MMASPAPADFAQCFAELERDGLLLQSDSKLPSVTTLVVGGPIRGSWWGHPLGQHIYRVTNALADHPDVVVTKLVAGKVTYLHRHLWPALLAVTAARQPWQIEGLSELACKMLDAVSEAGQLRANDVPWIGGKKPGEATRELERRLLVHGQETHTATGAHAKTLETWELWAARVGVSAGLITPDEGKRTLEHVLANLNARFEANGRLPWH